MSRLRVAVVGAGSFGRNHVRVVAQSSEVELTAIVDNDLDRAQSLARDCGTAAFSSVRDVLGNIDAAIVATPTVTHELIASELLCAGVDVLVEKPIADSSAAGERLGRLAAENGRILQVGHLERFNPAIAALQQILTLPLFFEIHRLSMFSPRSLDVDVILDLMIHDLDIVLAFTGQAPQEIRAAGISVLSRRVDIANVRLAFASGCIANLTASRVSTEKVRKLRLFQPGEYISVDYQRQDVLRLAVGKNEANLPRIDLRPMPVQTGEPLQLELDGFFLAVRARTPPRVGADQATNALRLAEEILVKIGEHEQLVAETLRHRRSPHR
jgi:predicted dehydrogenase